MNHFLRRFPQFTLLLWLVGCGPGVGGSGTGEPAQAAADFGAVAAPVCGAAFAPRLNCAPSPGGVSPPADAGTAPLSFVDMATGGQVSATLQANGVVLEARCQRLRFNGVWAVTGAGDARFYGTLTDDASGLSELASLGVTATEGGLQVLLRAFDGRVVLGPLVLRPLATSPDPVPACP